MKEKKFRYSFREWVNKHNRQDLIDRFDYLKNTLDIDEKVDILKSRFWLSCPRNLHESEEHCVLKIKDINISGLCRKCQSFYQWAVDNHREDLLQRWDNNKSPIDVRFADNNIYFFKCDRGIHESQGFKLCNVTIFNSKVTCNKCNSIAQYIIDQYGEDALYEYWSKGNTKSPWEVNRSARETIIINCQTKDYHNKYDCLAYSFASGDRCPYCSGKRIHPKDSLGVLLEKYSIKWSAKNNCSPYELPKRGVKEVWWTCEKHGDYLRKIDTSYICEFRCPYCEKETQSSYLQDKVVKYIQEKYGYEIKHEYDCTLRPVNPKTNRILPFDNEILDLKLEIEVDGLQHFYITSWAVHAAIRHNITPEEEFHKRKLYDRYKQYVALCNNFSYLRIPYWTERDESYKQLIDDKITEILKLREVA